MGGEIEIFPEWMLDPERKEDVLVFLRELPAPPRRRKEALVAWAQYVGLVLTKDDIRAILKPGEEYIESWRE